MVKVAMLFKSAAQREIKTYARENELAHGQNGETFYFPNLGKAQMYGVNAVANEEGITPWAQVYDYHNPTEQDRKLYDSLPAGAWFEDMNSKTMGRKGMFMLPPTSSR